MPLLSRKPKKNEDKPNGKGGSNMVINIFGANLDYGSSFGFALDGFHVPIVVRDCISYIEKNGIENEGIYRISGSSSRIEELKQKYDCLFTDRSIFYDVKVTSNDVASLFKLYLRRLSEPILSRNESLAMEKIILEGGENISLIQLEKLLFQLSESHYFTLGYICCHLKKVIDCSESNKMTHVNIAIVFSPTLSFNPKVLLTLIDHSDTLFPGCKSNSTASEIYERRNELLDSEEQQKYLISELRNKNMTLSLLLNMLGLLKESPEFYLISDIRIKVQASITSISRELKFHAIPVSTPELDQIDQIGQIKTNLEQSNEYEELNMKCNDYDLPMYRFHKKTSQTPNAIKKNGPIQKNFSIFDEYPQFDVYVPPPEANKRVKEKPKSQHNIDDFI